MKTRQNSTNIVGLISALALVLVATFALPQPSLATSDDAHAASPDAVVQEILTVHNVLSPELLDCEAILPEEWEALGEAVMQRMFGNNTDQHDTMDRMMGGEGSTSLRAMHERMGRMYLNCTDDDFGSGMMMGGMMNMMGGGPMGMMGSQGFGNQRSGFTSNNTFDSMMGFNDMGLGFGALGGIIMIAFWVLVIFGVVLLIQKLMRRDDTRERDQRIDKSAIDILKERYAKGEINHKEFEQKKKDIA